MGDFGLRCIFGVRDQDTEMVQASQEFSFVFVGIQHTDEVLQYPLWQACSGHLRFSEKSRHGRDNRYRYLMHASLDPVGT